MIQLAWTSTWNENAPDITPSIRISIELDNFSWFTIFYAIVQQQTHGSCGTTKHNKLYAPLIHDRSVRKLIRKL
jgi:hypothetical protein